MGSVDIPPFLRDKMKQKIQANGTEEIPPFLKKKESGGAEQPVDSQHSSESSPNGSPSPSLSELLSGAPAKEIPIAQRKKSNIEYDPYKFNQGEVYDKATNYLKGIKQDDADPVKTILGNEDRSMTGNMAKGRAVNFMLENVVPDGIEAKKILANPNIINDQSNETKKQLTAFATKAANEYDDIANRLDKVGVLYTFKFAGYHCRFSYCSFYKINCISIS